MSCFGRESASCPEVTVKFAERNAGIASFHLANRLSQCGGSIFDVCLRGIFGSPQIERFFWGKIRVANLEADADEPMEAGQIGFAGLLHT